ncbi:MAG: phosphatidylethanolamine-binding family protein [Nocardia sp.]|uniref:YbhB/YbcL family Raf kinase inhibitor-like protein n=1 Tax=Nocardia sp. TaxID=1821 RepID=UPI00260AAF58|nr:YbhB/YbcL family Raf kinase inhibitor-like protein [Nocardia sp.]MCU1640145.1 phosphatidylethanolamine-binding family protein [Nocardia sp.]
MIKHPIARLLRSVRAGIEKTAWHQAATAGAPELITVTSTAFDEGAAIPQRHAGKGVGADVSPALEWSGVPAAAVELVLIIEDPDAPLPRPIVHGLFSGIDAHRTGIPEGALALDNSAHPTSRVGVGSFKRRGYAGPRPIPGHGPHRYIFQLFALDAASGLGDESALAEALTAINGHVIARGKLTGIYERD